MDNPTLTNISALVGRILIAVIFLISGYGKIAGFDGVALLVLGYKVRWISILFFLWLIPTTYLFHRFWGIDAAQVQAQQINFLKNVSIMGGFLMLFGFGPGAYSLDRR